MKRNFLTGLKEKKNVVKLSMVALIGAVAVYGSAALCSASATKGVVDMDGKSVESWSINSSENTRARFDICRALSEGREDVAKCKQKAEAGDSLSMYALGTCYEWGRGVETDKVQAVEWYEKAANAGCKEAMMDVARCYANGIGVKKDEKIAHGWFENLSKSGEVQAMIYLAFDYATGTGVEKNEETAIYWYKKAGLSDDEVRESLQHDLDYVAIEKSESDSDTK